MQISVDEAEWEELAALAEEDEAIRLVGAQAQLDDGAPVRQIVVGRVNRHVAVAAEARLVTLLHIELVPGKMGEIFFMWQHSWVGVTSPVLIHMNLLFLVQQKAKMYR